MKKCSGFSAALLVVFMAHMLWAQERQNKSMEDGRPARQATASHDGRDARPPKTRDMSRELEAGTFRSAAPPLQGLRLRPPSKIHTPRATSVAASRTCQGIHPRPTFTRKTIAGSGTTREGTMFTIISITPGSMDASPERSDRNVSGGCMAEAASASTWAGSSFRRRRTTTMPAPTGYGIATTS